MKPTTVKRPFLSVGLVLVAMQGCAQPQAAADRLFAKSDWVVSGVSCPIGCSASTREFLKGQLGRRVSLDATRFDAPFVDRCAGSLRYLPQQQPLGEVLAELRRSAAPGAAPMNADHLGAGGKTYLTTARILCREAAGEMSYQRLLSVEPARVLVLFEEQSLIELR